MMVALTDLHTAKKDTAKMNDTRIIAELSLKVAALMDELDRKQALIEQLRKAVGGSGRM